MKTNYGTNAGNLISGSPSGSGNKTYQSLVYKLTDCIKIAAVLKVEKWFKNNE
jgi:hypothetical protein